MLFIYKTLLLSMLLPCKCSAPCTCVYQSICVWDVPYAQDAHTRMEPHFVLYEYRSTFSLQILASSNTLLLNTKHVDIYVASYMPKIVTFVIRKYVYFYTALECKWQSSGSSRDVHTVTH